MIWKMVEEQVLHLNKQILYAICGLVFGVVFNEVILIITSILSTFGIPFMNSNYWLLGASLIISISLLVLIFTWLD